MPKLEKTHDVFHRAEDMFALVCDVECYPEFVPLCQSLSIRNRKERGNKSLIVADMTMAYGPLSETFTTQVLMDPGALQIDVKYLEGPFKHLDNQWQFKELSEEKCRIHFLIDYELKSRMLAAAAGAVFDRAFAKFVDAFEARADRIYGS